MIVTALMTENTALIRMNILTSVIYREIIENLVWEKLWKKVINAELVALVANDT